MTTTTRELALTALYEDETFARANPVDQEDMVVHLIVALSGNSENMDRLARRERAEALELADFDVARMRRRRNFVN